MSREVVRADGEWDAHTIGSWRATILAALAASQAEEFVLDLSAVTFMDSAGINLIVDLDAACRDRGVHLVLASPRPQVVRMMAIVGIDKLVTVE